MPGLSKIMLIESSLFFLTMEKQFLNRMPITLLEANTSSQALEICRRSPPELIYLSTDLKDISGIECCRQLKADRRLKDIPVIMICSDGKTDPKVLTSHSGCDAVLFKPLDKKRFLEIGRSFLAGFREKRRACLITVRTRNGEAISAAKALDISSGGLFLKETELLPVGTTLDLDFNLAKVGEVGPRMNCRAKVSWHNTADNPTKPHHPVGFGLKFIDLPETTRNLLYGFLRVLDNTI